MYIKGFDGTYIKRVYPKIPQDYNRMDIDQRPQLEDFYTWDQLTYTIDPTLGKKKETMNTKKRYQLFS